MSLSASNKLDTQARKESTANAMKCYMKLFLCYDTFDPQI